MSIIQTGTRRLIARISPETPEVETTLENFTLIDESNGKRESSKPWWRVQLRLTRNDALILADMLIEHANLLPAGD